MRCLGRGGLPRCKPQAVDTDRSEHSPGRAGRGDTTAGRAQLQKAGRSAAATAASIALNTTRPIELTFTRQSRRTGETQMGTTNDEEKAVVKQHDPEGLPLSRELPAVRQHDQVSETSPSPLTAPPQGAGP